MKATLVLLLGLAAVSAFTTGKREDNTENEYQYYGEPSEDMDGGELNEEMNLKVSGEERVADYGSYSGYPSYTGYGSDYSSFPSYTGYGSGYSGYPSYTGYGSGYGYPSYTGYGSGYSGYPSYTGYGSGYSGYPSY